MIHSKSLETFQIDESPSLNNAHAALTALHSQPHSLTFVMSLHTHSPFPLLPYHCLVCVMPSILSSPYSPILIGNNHPMACVAVIITFLSLHLIFTSLVFIINPLPLLLIQLLLPSHHCIHCLISSPCQ